ncbi:MAG: hypothetical protein HY475_00605 [Candidatus Terrybacteria bacterium]|nr:hypothetical protein [Candidatus Terrybacteria bacterium]
MAMMLSIPAGIRRAFGWVKEEAVRAGVRDLGKHGDGMLFLEHRFCSTRLRRGQDLHGGAFVRWCPRCCVIVP